MTANMAPCRGCGETRKLIRAHIIPESFCIRLVREVAPAKVVCPNEYVKNSHTGIYDSTILCESCEGKFSLPDDYAQDLLLKKKNTFEPVVVNGELSAEIAKDYDHALLHRFILAVLWRASVSSQNFFKDVDLGSHQQSIKELAFGEKNASDYPFWAGKLLHTTADNMMLAPVRKKIDGVNYWGVYVGDFHFWVKVDSGRSIPTSMLDVHAKPDSSLIIVCRNLIGSPEHRAAIQAARLRKVGKSE